MKLCNPDWRWKQLISALDKEIPPEDAYASVAYYVVKGKREDFVIQTAIDNILDVEYRDHLVAFILSGSTPEATCKCIDMKMEAYNAFKKLYLDTETFRHRIELRRFAKHYVANICEDKDAKRLLKKGVIEGPAGIEHFWQRGNESLPYTPKEMYRSLTDMSYAKAMTARTCDITAKESQEGVKWVTTALRALTKVDLIQFDDLGTDLDSLVAIQSKEHTHTAEELGLNPADILN